MLHVLCIELKKRKWIKQLIHSSRTIIYFRNHHRNIHHLNRKQICTHPVLKELNLSESTGRTFTAYALQYNKDLLGLDTWSPRPTQTLYQPLIQGYTLTEFNYKKFKYNQGSYRTKKHTAAISRRLKII